MDLWESILVQAIAKQGVIVSIPAAPDFEKLFEMACYKAPQDIRAVLMDDSLSDQGCFLQIEEIVTVFENLGSDADARHDFG